MKSQDEKTEKIEITSAEEDLSPEEMKKEILKLREELAYERKQKEFLLSAIESLPNPVFVKDKHGKFVFFNAKYEEFFGMSREEFLGKSVLDLPYLSMEDRERYQKEDIHLIENAFVLNYDVDFISAEGEIHPSFYWSKGFETPETGEKGLVGEIVDISKERKLEATLKINIEQLEKANATIADTSKTDAITGLYNRRILDEQKEILMAENAKNSVPICIIMADLDFFKSVNDTFGHLTGDNVLVNFAKILRDSCREKDIPVRYGGEEFLIFLQNVDLPIAKKVAERIRGKTARDLVLPDGKTITVSLGVSQYQYGEDLYKCVARADAALYRAKKTGRNKVATE